MRLRPDSGPVTQSGSGSDSARPPPPHTRETLTYPSAQAAGSKMNNFFFTSNLERSAAASVPLSREEAGTPADPPCWNSLDLLWCSAEYHPSTLVSEFYTQQGRGKEGSGTHRGKEKDQRKRGRGPS